MLPNIVSLSDESIYLLMMKPVIYTPSVHPSDLIVIVFNHLMLVNVGDSAVMY